jgi:hypothetical protein
MRYPLSLLAVALLSFCGCSADPVHVGTIVSTADLDPRWNDSAPTVPIRCSDGHVMTLREASGPTYVVAFVPAADPSGCGIDPQLAQLSDDLLKFSVTVVQVTQLGQDHPLAGLQPERCPPPIRNRMLLLDPQGIGWRAFGRPEAGTLMVVNNRGDIVQIGTMDDLVSIFHGARDAASQFQQDQQQLLFGWTSWFNNGWN